jgi:hypothetical protein
MYQQFPPWSFNHWAPYSAGPSVHFIPKYIPQRHALRPYSHERKACFSHEARSHDAILIQQIQSPIRKEDGNIYKGGHKFKWVPIKRASHAEAHDGIERGFTKINTEKGTSLHVDLEPGVQTCPEKDVVPASFGKSVDALSNLFTGSSVKVRDNGKAAYGIKLREHQSSEGAVNGTETSSDVEKASVQKEVVCTEEDANCAELPQTGSDKFEKETSSNLNLHNGGDKALFVSSSICQKLDSVNRRTNSAMRCISSGTSKNLPPVGFKYSTNTSTRWDSSNRGRHGVESSHVFDQQMVLSNRDKIFAPKATVCKYRPRNLGDSRIKSVGPRTKPRPQWCPTGLTHT